MYLILKHNNIILSDATGNEKICMACALDVAASKWFFAVEHIRLPDILVESRLQEAPV